MSYKANSTHTITKKKMSKTALLIQKLLNQQEIKYNGAMIILAKKRKDDQLTKHLILEGLRLREIELLLYTETHKRYLTE